MSTIESLVAAVLLGITGVVALTAWDTAVVAAHDATHAAWARCMARSQMEYVLAAPWQSTYTSINPSLIQVAAVTPNPRVQQVTVTVGQPGPQQYQLTALKSLDLAAAANSHAPGSVSAGCPPP